MFDHFPEMTITVSGGSFEENQQMCTAVRSALRKNGFRNIDIDACSAWGNPAATDETILACIHAINPDLRDNHILIQGECQQDIETMAALIPTFSGAAEVINFWE